MTSPAMDPALRAAVDDAYRVFGGYRVPAFPLDVCLACCVSPEDERELREWPLAQLTRSHLWTYNDSAKKAIQDPRDVGYFVPRLLELLAEGAEIHHSMEVSLDRLGRCPAGSWNGEERAALDRFALAYFDVVLRDGVDRWPDDALTVLAMFEIGGVAIDPLLEFWLQCDAPMAAIQYVWATYFGFWDDGRYDGAFTADRPAFTERLTRWLTDADCRRRFAARLSTPEFRALAQRQHDMGPHPFTTAAEIVLIHLTR